MPSSQYFLDASFLIAYLKKDDLSHRLALTSAEKLVTPETKLYINFVALSEAVTVLSQRVSKKLGNYLISKYEEGVFAEIEITPEVKTRAMEIFRSKRSKNFPFFDAIHFASMEEVGLNSALTLDRHFKKHGFKVFPN